VLLGSANINDRSLMGNRDSEMAVLVMDTNNAVEDIGAFEGPQVTRKLARDLRMRVWKKLFCLSGAKANVKPASKLIDAVKRPAAQGSWEAIREVAERNSTLYEEAFAFIPRNPVAKDIKIPLEQALPKNVSIWPTKYVDGNAVAAGLMPFDEKFWITSRHTAAVKDLGGVQGFITLLPWLWTRGENNNNGYHSALYVENKPPKSIPELRSDEEFAALDQRGAAEAENGETG
jgi:phospholipase D1/2